MLAHSSERLSFRHNRAHFSKNLPHVSRVKSLHSGIDLLLFLEQCNTDDTAARAYFGGKRA